MLFSIMAELVIVFLTGSFFLPKSYSVKRITSINAPDAVIYNNIANFNNFYQWNLRVKMETLMKVNFQGNRYSQTNDMNAKGQKPDLVR